MKDEILSKFNAVCCMRKLGIEVTERDVYVGRFFIRKGHGKKGLGVCFMADYHGVLTSYAFLNVFLQFINFMIPQRFEKNYVVYVKAFSGRNVRKAAYEILEQTEYINFDAINVSFMADGREWKVRDGRIIPFAPVARRVI